MAGAVGTVCLDGGRQFPHEKPMFEWPAKLKLLCSPNPPCHVHQNKKRGGHVEKKVRKSVLAMALGKGHNSLN